MGKRKISHAAYAAWDYKKEIEDLNKKSQEGWQLVKEDASKAYMSRMIKHATAISWIIIPI